MNEFLIIHYKPGHKSNLHYWAMGADQHPSITLGHGSLDELKAISRGKKVSVLIDAHYTTLECVKIPSKNRSKQLQAIPFAMEDQLAEDIEDTHFALGKADDNTVPVIAIKRELLQETIDLFKQQNIHIETLTADSIALPGNKSDWCVLLDEDSALIKTGPSQAHCCDRENLTVILQALLSQNNNSNDNNTQPETITYYYKEDDSEAEALLQNIEINIKAQPYKNHALEIFVRHLKEVQAFNLLQGEFTPKRESVTWLKPWKSVAIAASTWMVLHLGYNGMLAADLEKKNLVLTKQIETEFKRAIPDARKMTNMQKRVERRLKELKSGGAGSSEGGFLEILSKVSPALSKNDRTNIKAAVYRNNYIDIDLTAKSLQDIEALKNKLAAIPGIKTVLSTTVEKDSVKGRLRLEVKG
ncbi:MAG: type II secretion system protein GspL [Gammaproteobacteria bacterium]|nr:type II secretion system protein GspL [Gammaproteobacteria bacterium]